MFSSQISSEFANQMIWQGQFFQALESLTNHMSLNEGVELEASKPIFPSMEEIPLDQFDPIKFHKDLSQYNRKVVKAVKNIFERDLPELAQQKSLCVAITGSDGREEKMSSTSSLIELIVVVPQKADLQNPLIAKISTYARAHPTLFFPEIEVKCLETDGLVLFQGPKSERPFPTRALDALYLSGSEQLMKEYRNQFFEELQKTQSNKLLRKFHLTAIIPANKLLEHSLKDQKSDVDIEKGILKYDGHRIKATKYPLLRVVQYNLAQHIFKLVNKNKIDKKTFLELPTGTIERIQWLAEKNLLNMKPEDVKTLQRSYAISMLWFENTQRLFETKKQTELQVEPARLKEVALSISHFYSTKSDLSVSENGK